MHLTVSLWYPYGKVMELETGANVKNVHVRKNTINIVGALELMYYICSIKKE